jgi:hypothetical protein
MSAVPEVIHVEVVDCEAGSDHGPSSDGPLRNVIAWFKEQLEKIPEGHRGTARCEIDGVPDKYDSGCDANIRITYTRLETHDEVLARAAAGETKTKDARDREIATLRTLAARYPEELP